MFEQKTIKESLKKKNRCVKKTGTPLKHTSKLKITFN